MATNKTTETAKSVTAFINAVKDEIKRKDSFQLIEIMSGITGFEPKMWGPAIVGFGTYHYTYDSGREGDMPIVCFSPRANALVLYLGSGFDKREEFLKQLGKHTTGKGCLYIKKLDDISLAVLKKMIMASFKHIRSLYPDKRKK